MIEEYLGIPTDYVVAGLAGVVLILLILFIVLLVKTAKLKGRLNRFMTGKTGKNLEDTLVRRLDQVDDLQKETDNNSRSIKKINKRMEKAFQKFNLLKYDAFEENGGRLSTVLVMLDEKNNGYILNVVHGREGSYTYTKEIIDGNSVTQLGDEEAEALSRAMNGNPEDSI